MVHYYSSEDNPSIIDNINLFDHRIVQKKRKDISLILSQIKTIFDGSTALTMAYHKQILLLQQSEIHYLMNIFSLMETFYIFALKCS